MFGPMRRTRQELSKEEWEDLLRHGTSGVLAVLDTDGYPYAVPLSYWYHDGTLIFHGATTGRKLEAIKNYAKASFCVIAQDDVVPLEYTTNYRSVIAFGTIYIITDEVEKRQTVEALMKKYAPHDTDAHRDAEIAHAWNALCMMKLDITHVTGKESRLLAQKRHGK